MLLAIANAVFDVSRAAPVLDMKPPGVTWMPGSVQLSGRLFSEIGALSGASVRVKLGQSQTEFVTSEDGAFRTLS